MDERPWLLANLMGSTGSFWLWTLASLLVGMLCGFFLGLSRRVLPPQGAAEVEGLGNRNGRAHARSRVPRSRSESLFDDEQEGQGAAAATAAAAVDSVKNQAAATGGSARALAGKGGGPLAKKSVVAGARAVGAARKEVGLAKAEVSAGKEAKVVKPRDAATTGGVSNRAAAIQRREVAVGDSEVAAKAKAKVDAASAKPLVAGKLAQDGPAKPIATAVRDEVATGPGARVMPQRREGPPRSLAADQAEVRDGSQGSSSIANEGQVRPDADESDGREGANVGGAEGSSEPRDSDAGLEGVDGPVPPQGQAAGPVPVALPAEGLSGRVERVKDESKTEIEPKALAARAVAPTSVQAKAVVMPKALERQVSTAARVAPPVGVVPPVAGAGEEAEVGDLAARSGQDDREQTGTELPGTAGASAVGLAERDDAEDAALPLDQRRAGEADDDAHDATAVREVVVGAEAGAGASPQAENSAPQESSNAAVAEDSAIKEGRVLESQSRSAGEAEESAEVENELATEVADSELEGDEGPVKGPEPEEDPEVVAQREADAAAFELGWQEWVRDWAQEQNLSQQELLGWVFERPPLPNRELERIDGIGPRVRHDLGVMGIHRLEQVAGWTEAQARHISEQLNFPGRAIHEQWIAQARELVRGTLN